MCNYFEYEPFVQEEMFIICLFDLLALPPKSTAMAMAGGSIHLTTLFSWEMFIRFLCFSRVEPFMQFW